MTVNLRRRVGIQNDSIPTVANRDTTPDIRVHDEIDHQQIGKPPSLVISEMDGLLGVRKDWVPTLAGIVSSWTAVGAIVGLIFGGCCSNVSQPASSSLP